MRPILRWFAALATLTSVLAQQAPELQILVIGGEGSINNVKQRTAREPVIEVRDRNNRPIAGAAVVFEAPRDGASGTFIGNSPTLRVTTDAQGRAMGQGFRPNNTAGNFSVKVSATYQGSTASTAINMTNILGAGAAGAGTAAISGKLIGILIGVGAAVAAGTAIAVTRNGGGPSAPPAAPPTTISAGTGTVGGR